jgi:hypothetical protein
MDARGYFYEATAAHAGDWFGMMRDMPKGLSQATDKAGVLDGA